MGLPMSIAVMTDVQSWVGVSCFNKNNNNNNNIIIIIINNKLQVISFVFAYFIELYIKFFHLFIFQEKLLLTKKRIQTSFLPLVYAGLPAEIRMFTMNEKSWRDEFKGHNIDRLLSPSGEAVATFDNME